MGLVDFDANRIDGGEVVINMNKNWGRMPYPKFLETAPVLILQDGELIWEGMCYFAYRSRTVVERDGVRHEVAARATTEEDLGKCGVKLGGPGTELRVLTGGETKNFFVVNYVPKYNPDGSFHHITMNLLEGAEACGDAIFEE